MIVTDKTSKIDAVAVAAVMRQADANVMEQAHAKYAADLDTYRRGVRRAAETGGTLAPDEADTLLQVARALGITAERLEADIVTIIRHGRITAVIGKIHERNEERAIRAAQLKARLEAEREAFIPQRVEAERILREANARLDAANRDYEKAANERYERVDEQTAEARRLEDAAPYLFRDLEPGHLRRIVGR